MKLVRAEQIFHSPVTMEDGGNMLALWVSFSSEPGLLQDLARLLDVSPAVVISMVRFKLSYFDLQYPRSQRGAHVPRPYRGV